MKAVILTVLMVSSSSWAAAPHNHDCANLLSEVRAMQEAQKTLLNNMAQNNLTMASTLDNYSDQLKDSSRQRRPVTAKDITSLHQSADAFRSHGARETKLVSKFTKATDGLMKRVEACLVE